MKKVMRKYVWETNSSAVHSLVYSKEGLEPSCLPTNEEGYILTDFGDFGEYDMGITVFDQATKLSYLATECWYLSGSFYPEINDNCYQWRDICEAICEYTGAPGVRILGNVEPSLDHQVQPDYEPKFVNHWHSEDVINFIFNRFVGIKMSHD